MKYKSGKAERELAVLILTLLTFWSKYQNMDSFAPLDMLFKHFTTRGH